METGHIVYFASQKSPFLVEAEPCLDLGCSCRNMTLTLSELILPGSPRRDSLRFTIRVSLRTWREQDAPPRSLEVETLVGEFLARFPDERIDELVQQFETARARKKRQASLVLTGPRTELVSYSSVLDSRGSVREGVTQHCFFFVFEGREFLVEDQYCANPDCDCQQVHLEFWERVHQFYPKHKITIKQLLRASYALDGTMKEIPFSDESESTTKYLLRAWEHRGGCHFPEFRRRYTLIKTIGSRSFTSPPEPQPPSSPVKTTATPPRRIDQRHAAATTKQRVRRNDPCPCGSGLKYKRCCATRPPSGLTHDSALLFCLMPLAPSAHIDFVHRQFRNSAIAAGCS